LEAPEGGVEQNAGTMNSPSFCKYLSEIGTIPLLTHEREVELGRAVQVGLRSDASEAGRQASEEAQHELIQSSLKLVVSIARRYYWFALTLEEMTFDGNQGLTTAAKRYNPIQFKTRFSTYATFWIHNSIQQAIQRSYTIRTPTERAMQFKRILECHSFIEGKPDQDVDKIHEETGISKRQIARILTNPCTVVSLSAAKCDDDDEGIEAVLDSGCENPAEAVMREEELRLLQTVLSGLDSVHRNIIRTRFGITSGNPEAPDDLAAIYGVSQAHIRRIEKQALKELRLKLNQLLS
jgi:RNA polymerase sigma factor (sigma-70 family)